MFRIIKTIGKIIYFLIIGVIVTSGSVLILSTFNTPVNIRLFSVLSESMTPAIPLGAVVVTIPQKTYQEKDIITIRSETNPKDTVTHRITSIREDTDKKTVFYETKGDANKTSDVEPIDSRRVIGKVVFTIPKLGYFITFAQSQTGLIVLIIIPATIIAYSEVNNIMSEIKKMFQKKKRDEQ